MSWKNRVLAMAVLGVLPLGSAAWASDAGTQLDLKSNALDQPKYAVDAPAPTTPAAPAAAAPAAAPDRAPLMSLLNMGGMADPLEKANINIYGFFEGSYTYNFDGDRNPNFGRIFDFESNKGVFNQADLSIERTVDASKKQFDVGGHLELLYGADVRFTHSNGLLDHETPEIQFDIVQAYVDVAVPIGNGLRVRAGKFVTLMGWETINPTTNALYSHSYLFNFAIPFTHTGVMGSYQINDNWLVEGGIFRGWEQSIDDNNGAISGHFKVGYTSTDKKLGVIGQFVTGPEQSGNTGDYRTVFDGQVSYAFTDKLTYALNADLGYDSNASSNGGTAWWYGIANYLGYKINDTFTANGRLEWFRDDGGSRTGVSANFYEMTLGLAITPFSSDKVLKDLLIRPEFRVDISDQRAYANASQQEMFTAALDVIFKF